MTILVVPENGEAVPVNSMSELLEETERLNDVGEPYIITKP